MKLNRATLVLIFTFIIVNGFSQSDKTVEMADIMRRDGKIYSVVIALVVVLTGVVIFLLRVDKKVSKLKEPGDKK